MKINQIFIIGAGRSGTNMLRDTICKIEGYETWPCDEINYLWKHGNISKKDDHFGKSEASEKTINFINKQFRRFQLQTGAQNIVEKTCANSLRINFINEIFPNAKFIFIVRDGKDVVASAIQRWKAPLDINYIFKKAKYIPLSDFGIYAYKYLINRIKKFFTKDKRLAYWGPIYNNMKRDLETLSLEEVSAKQWGMCVKEAFDDLSLLNQNKVHMMTYEKFVNNPTLEFERVLNFLNIDKSNINIDSITKYISNKSVGNYKKTLDSNRLMKIESIIQPLMKNTYNKINEL